MPDEERITRRLEALWQIAFGPGGGADRPAFSPTEAAAMRLVAGWAAEAGLKAGIDRHGNLWALPEGWSGPLVTSGSHVDTVPDGGRYDGALGTVLGLELAHDLHAGAAGGARPGLLVCAAEEAPRFGAGTIGSRLLVGSLGQAELGELRDERGISAAEAQAEYLEVLSGLDRVDPPVGRLRGHVEVHVAQRRALRTLGVVTRVASPRRFEVTLTGAAGHAGEVTMDDRRDALAAAAELVLAVEAAARAEPPATVATVGTIAVQPGAISVIPERARLGIDIRAIDAASLHRVDAAIRAAVGLVADRRHVAAHLQLTRDGEPAALDPDFARTALHAAGRWRIPAQETWSGAGHDAQHLGALMPTLLLFVPLHAGASHTPHEGADLKEILQAAQVAAAVLTR